MYMASSKLSDAVTLSSVWPAEMKSCEIPGYLSPTCHAQKGGLLIIEQGVFWL